MLFGQKIFLSLVGVSGAAVSCYFGLSDLFKHKTLRDKFSSENKVILPNDDANKEEWKQRAQNYSSDTENKITGFEISSTDDEAKKAKDFYDKCSELLDSSLKVGNLSQLEAWVEKWCLKK